MDSENNLTTEELLKVHKRRRLNIITNVILIILILVISIYVIYNIELIKSANQDWCFLCMQKTGSICSPKIILP
jgi:hypothetical protein